MVITSTDLEPTPIVYVTTYISRQLYNVSWRSISSKGDNKKFTVKVQSRGSFMKTFYPHKPYFILNTPEDAPLCDVFNFTGSASYTGATYTGAGCSMPSTESMMLPSLPNITRLESSLQFCLTKRFERINLSVSFVVS